MVVTSPVFSDVLDRLSAQCDVLMNPGPDPWPAAVLTHNLAVAEAMIAFMPDRVDDATLDAAPRLRHIACALKGWDNFDVAACARRGILVSVVEDLLTIPTAELAVGLMVALGRHLQSADASIRARGFNGWRPTFYGTGIAGRTLGFVGMGAIGQAIATLLRPWGATMLYHDARALTDTTEAALGLRRVSLDKLLPEADWIVLALPLTPATLHIIDESRLGQIKLGALLVNPARGSLVDEAAVAAALAAGRLAGYAADVFECEDWARSDRPAGIHPQLLASSRTVLTPHLGSAVVEVRNRIEHAAADNVLAVLQGRKPKGCLNWPAEQAE